MFAFDSRRAFDPAHSLGQGTVATLRSALFEQRTAGQEPTAALQHAIAAAATEARGRNLAPEILLIQLKALADEVGLRPIAHATHPAMPVSVREWMVGALLRGYWQATD
jgi:hypothetical protein